MINAYQNSSMNHQTLKKDDIAGRYMTLSSGGAKLRQHVLSIVSQQ